MTIDDLKQRLNRVVVTFRGYNTTNVGRTRELLADERYREILLPHLKQASAHADATLNRHCSLIERIESGAPSSMATYAADVAMIVAVELAQIEMLERLFDVDIKQVNCLFGYSLGEVTAVIAAGIFQYEDVMTPILQMADDAARLSDNVTMGILFSRARVMDFMKIGRMCQEITAEGKGTISISTYLSPNTVLLLGQNNTVDRFKELMEKYLPRGTHLKKNPDRWPPLHTPIVRQACLPDRAAVTLEKTPGGFTTPHPPILSCVTGRKSYVEGAAREHLIDWVDHPQRLWQAIQVLLGSDVEMILHLGPEPNLIPATMNRLAENVKAQVSEQTWAGFGLRTWSQISLGRPWLASVISSDANILRAPFIKQINFEDVLLAQ